MGALIIQRTPTRADKGRTDWRAQFRVGDDVLITILGIKGNQVRVAIDAPKHVAVHREEIYQRIRGETPTGTPVHPYPHDRSNGNG